MSAQVADTGNNQIRHVTYPDGFVSWFAGGDMGLRDGTRSDAQFNGPRCLAYSAGGVLLVGDYFNGRVRRIDSGGDTVSTFAGSEVAVQNKRVDGAACMATFSGITAIALDHTGNLIVTEQYQDDKFRVVTETGLDPPLEFWKARQAAAAVDTAMSICHLTLGRCVRDFRDGFGKTLDHALMMAEVGSAARERGRALMLDSKHYGEHRASAFSRPTQAVVG